MVEREGHRELAPIPRKVEGVLNPLGILLATNIQSRGVMGYVTEKEGTTPQRVLTEQMFPRLNPSAFPEGEDRRTAQMLSGLLSQFDPQQEGRDLYAYIADIPATDYVVLTAALSENHDASEKWLLALHGHLIHLPIDAIVKPYNDAAKEVNSHGGEIALLSADPNVHQDRRPVIEYDVPPDLSGETEDS